MNWVIPRKSAEPLEISLEPGARFFIVGPNGSGKSALIQHFVSEHRDQSLRRISAHRQSWLDSGSLNLTPLSRRQFEHDSTNYERSYESRWRDEYADQKQSAVLFDLVAEENTRARSITSLVDGSKPKKAAELASKSKPAFKNLNDLLALGTLQIALENSNDEEILARHRDVDAPYSIAQMSDGERNAAIIGATVVTVEPGTVLLIDEPERHLHRSIIVPFLAALFAQRQDCPFIVSTHELALPAANPAAGVLMVRSCEWEGVQAKTWEVDLLAPNAEIPEELRLGILGSRRKAVFFEGTGSSMDLPLYHALFPDVSAVAVGTSTDVQRAVQGLRSSYDLHHVEAYGLVDSDGKPQDVIDSLAEREIYALAAYSVESLYYCSDALDAVAKWQASTLGRDHESLTDAALDAAFVALGVDGLAERMAARRCEHLVRDEVMSRIPSWKEIMDDSVGTLEISVNSPFHVELTRFSQLLKDKAVDQLIARYPLRESRVFNAISQALEFRNRELYEQALIARIRSNAALAQRLRDRIGPLSLVLGSHTNGTVQEA